MPSSHLVVPQSARLNQLSILISQQLSGYYLKLFQAGITISDTTVISDFTECTFTGYDAVPTPTWTSPALNGSNRAFTTPTAAPVFQYTGLTNSGNIYGCYLADVGDTEFAGATTFASGPVVLAADETLTVAFTYTDQTEYTSP